MNHENQTGVLNIVRGQRESTSGVSSMKKPPS